MNRQAMRKLLLLILLLGSSLVSLAQGFFLEPGFRYSKHIPFPDFADYPVYEADLRLGWQTTGKKDWQRHFNYPNIGLGLRYEHNTMSISGTVFSEGNLTKLRQIVNDVSHD